MENKFNIEEVNTWLKEEYGMSYDELSKEFNKAVDLLSKSLKQRKEMRDKINKANELKHNWQNIKENETIVFENNSLIEFMNNLEKILKEDK